MPIKLPEIAVEAIYSLDEAKQVIKHLLNSLEVVFKELETVKKENALLKQEIARLKQQPKQPHVSRQQPSFSATKLLKTKDKHWHKSVRKPIEIDQNVQLPEVEQCTCGSTEFETIKTTTKVVQGIAITRNNTAYHGRRKKCRSCGKISTTRIPEDVKGLSFDSATHTIASYLKFVCRLTNPLLYRLFTDVGMQISYGELTTILHRNSQKLHPAYLRLKTTGVYKSRYLQADATGAKRKQLATGAIVNQQLHFVGNSMLSLFKITKHYNSEMMNVLLGKHGRKKLYVSDDAGANGRKLKNKRKQLCWIHEDRHYLKLSPRLKRHREHVQLVITQLLDFYHLAKAYGRDPTVQKKKELRECFDRIVNQVTGYDALDKQLTLTKRKRDRLLLFLEYPFLPIHNNQCERDLRELVLIRSISGGTKSLAGDRSLERHLSVIQTAKKQGLNVFQTLHGLLTGALSPAVLTMKTV